MSSFDRLSGALQYQIVNGLGFRDLRPVQLQAIDTLLDGKNAVVLAPTAGGKTEAALFPVLSMVDSEDWRPVSVLYLSPIRALLNNQESRVSRYAGVVGRRAFKWHGDTSQSARKRFLDDPTDILLITPESLEAMLMSGRIPARQLFAGLRVAIIDEVHAFADDDRGAHLSALLERLTRFCGRDIQRIGLSATVGNPDEILRWLQGSSKRDRSIVNPGGTGREPELSLDYVGGLENAARVIELLHPGRKRLVFVDSRSKAEQLGNLLGQREVVTFVTHGSLSARERHDAERAFHEGSNCVIVATSALELGIDVGDLDHVLQIDSPPSVASFLQRMGRTGRRGGAANCTFLATKESAVLQASAIVRLFREGFVEPVTPSQAAYHILAHQLMALAVQHGGVGRGDWWAWLEGATVLGQVTAAEREAVQAHMLEGDILSDQEGKLWLGREGERRYGRANFRELYAVFDSPRMVTVRAGQDEVGSVDASFLAAIDSDAERGAFMLGGRAWQIITIEWERGICVVQPAREGRAPRWVGGAQFLGFELCQAMRKVLLASEDDPALSQRARRVMETQRAEFLFLKDEPAPFVQNSEEITWWTFAGGAANLLLARMLESALGEKVVSKNTSITLKEDAGRSLAAVREFVRDISVRGGPDVEDASRHAEGAGARGRMSKFDPCLPQALFAKLVVENVLDVAGAQKAAAMTAPAVTHDATECPPDVVTEGLVEKLEALLPALEGPGPHGELVERPPTDDGVFVMPIWRYEPHVEAFQRVAYEHNLVFSFDWPAWLETPEGRQFRESSEGIATADLLMLRRLTTVHVRKERFCEGHLAEMAERGDLAALARRIIEVVGSRKGARR
ncbi:MAG: DEAD/DEAH box helicase [Polyangiaceae bacterium]|nr:DEAD/DEAH box helicase [Polyangiaceae bacterium]